MTKAQIFELEERRICANCAKVHGGMRCMQGIDERWNKNCTMWCIVKTFIFECCNASGYDGVQCMLPIIDMELDNFTIWCTLKGLNCRRVMQVCMYNFHVQMRKHASQYSNMCLWVGGEIHTWECECFKKYVCMLC